MAGEIAKLENKESETGGIVFAGSSSIRLWTRLEDDFPDLPVVNCGFGGSTANDLIVYFDKVVARHEPKLIVTYTGGNDLNFKLSVDEVFDDYTRFLLMVHERFPDTRALLTSVKISQSRATQIPAVHELNRRLEAWSRERSWVRYLDCTNHLADSDGRPIPSMFREDQLHLSPVGYAHWLIQLDPVLREEWARVR
jgi:lysophospholipase L1-like esterase